MDNRHAVLAAKSGQFAVQARMFIDATGDGDLAGAPFEKIGADGQLYDRQYLRGFAPMEPVATASQLGCRESRRIVGDYVLNLEDYLPRPDRGSDARASSCLPIGVRGTERRAGFHPKIPAATPAVTRESEQTVIFRRHRHGVGGERTPALPRRL